MMIITKNKKNSCKECGATPAPHEYRLTTGCKNCGTKHTHNPVFLCDDHHKLVVRLAKELVESGEQEELLFTSNESIEELKEYRVQQH